MNKAFTILEILRALNVENVTRDKVMEIFKSNVDKSIQFILEEYIKTFNPDLYKLYQQSTVPIIDYSQYQNFEKYINQKKLIIDGYIRNEYNSNKWANPLNSIISIYYSYFILCNIKSSNFNYISPKGIVMESYCKINDENIEINKKPDDEGIDGRGIHLITMDNIHGNILNVNNFDVWGSSQCGKQFENQCRKIKSNNICFIFLKDSGETYSENGLTLLSKKYNINTNALKWRETYICIFHTNNNNNSNIYYECVGEQESSIQCEIALKLSQHCT